MLPPLPDEFTERYFDELQSIEFAIVAIYRKHPELNDQNVHKVLEMLERSYKAEAANRKPLVLKFSPLEQELYDAVKSVCDWRIGRIENPAITGGMPSSGAPIDVDEIIACLKRTLRSVKLWNKDFGIRGYLNFIVQFFPDGGS